MDEEKNELTTEFTADAQAEVKALKAMHMELSEVKDPIEKKRLKTEILKKVKLLEDLLHQKKDHQSSTTTTTSPPPSSGVPRSSGILTKDEFDFDDKAQCGNFMIFLSLRFCVKSNLGFLEVLNLSLSHI